MQQPLRWRHQRRKRQPTVIQVKAAEEEAEETAAAIQVEATKEIIAATNQVEATKEEKTATTI
jgi:hypothetical protein